MKDDSPWLVELLELLEAPKLVYSQTAVGRRIHLIRSGLLVPNDFQHAVLDERGEPMEVSFDDNRGGLGYHDPYRGWIAVEQGKLQRFSPNLDRLFAAILGDEFRPFPRGIRAVEPEYIWEIGSAQLTRLGQTEIWYARRLGDPTALDRLREALERRPSLRMQLILTSTSGHDLPKPLLVRARIVPIAEVISSREPDRIDLERLKARFQNHEDEDVDQVVHLSGDNCVLSLHGHVVVRVKTDLHRKLLYQIVQEHQKSGCVDRKAVLDRAQSKARSFDQAFGKRHWPALNSVFKYDKRNRVWRFAI